MRSIWDDVEKWRQAGEPAALATVVQVQGSSLRPAGSKMAISAAGRISGSVTGGCVEGAVFEEAQAALKTGAPRLVSYGVPNTAAWEVGLACGGSIEVFVESLETAPWQSLAPAIRECLQNKELAALATVVAGPGSGKKLLQRADGRRYGDLGPVGPEVFPGAPTEWPSQDPKTIRVPTPQGEARVFIDFVVPSPRLIIVGAVHMAIPLVTLAKALNFHTIVVDARSAFATRERFPHVDELIVDWPADALRKLNLDAATCLVCLSHDEKMDVPALQVGLESPARYIGALGSRRTHARRLDALREEGFEEGLFARIHAPVGLDLGAQFPEEIALAVLAEIVATKHSHGRQSLCSDSPDLSLASQCDPPA